MLGLLLGGLWLWALRLWLQAHLFLNADTLSVPEIWATLRAGGRLGDWSMGNHAFIFPDLALYQVAAWITPGVAERQVAYGLVLGFLAWWIGASLAAELFYLKRSQARAYVAVGLAAVLPFLKEESGLGQWFFPSHHGGAFLASLALMVWVLRQRQRPSGPWNVLWVGLLCGLTHASDAVFATWALLPAVCLSLPQSWALRARLAAVIVLSFCFKFLFIAGLKAQGMKLLHFEWGYFWAHAHELLSQAAQQSSGFAITYAVPLSLAALFACWLLMRWRSEPSPAALGLAWCGLLAVTLILASLQGQLSGRYLTWCLWVPALLAPAWVAGRWPALSRWALILPAGLVFFWVTLFKPVIPADQPEQRQATWLDAQLAQRGVTLGWSDYWHSRPLRLFSRQGAQLIPVITDWGALQPFEWVSYRPFFSADPELKHPQFVVLNGLDPAKVVDRLKRKGREVRGEGLTVWFYGPEGKMETR